MKQLTRALLLFFNTIGVGTASTIVTCSKRHSLHLAKDLRKYYELGSNWSICQFCYVIRRFDQLPCHCKTRKYYLKYFIKNNISLIIIFIGNLAIHLRAQNNFGISFNAGAAIPYGVFAKKDASASVYTNLNSTPPAYRGFVKANSGFSCVGRSISVEVFNNFKIPLFISFAYQRSLNSSDPSSLSDYLNFPINSNFYTVELSNTQMQSLIFNTLYRLEFKRFNVLIGPVFNLSKVGFPSISFYHLIDNNPDYKVLVTDSESRNLSSFGIGLNFKSWYCVTKHIVVGITSCFQNNNFKYSLIYRRTGGNPSDPIVDIFKTRILHLGINIGYLF